MKYSSKTKADRIIFGILMCKLAKGHFAVDKAIIQRQSGLTENEFAIGLDMLVSEGMVRKQLGQQLALTRQGIISYELNYPLTLA